MSDIRHFLTLLDFSPQELQQLILRSIEMKQAYRAGNDQRAFPGSVLAMFFAKSSTRTRVSFEAGMAQLGGHAMFLSAQDTAAASPARVRAGWEMAITCASLTLMPHGNSILSCASLAPQGSSPTVRYSKPIVTGSSLSTIQRPPRAAPIWW